MHLTVLGHCRVSVVEQVTLIMSSNGDVTISKELDAN